MYVIFFFYTVSLNLVLCTTYSAVEWEYVIKLQSSKMIKLTTKHVAYKKEKTGQIVRIGEDAKL